MSQCQFPVTTLPPLTGVVAWSGVWAGRCCAEALCLWSLERSAPSMLQSTSVQTPVTSGGSSTGSDCRPWRVSVRTRVQTQNSAQLLPPSTSSFMCVYTVRAESGDDDLTLTCVLTCATECDSDSSLSWRGGGARGWQNTSVSVNGTLRNRLVLPVSSAPADDLTCVVLSDGIVMASKNWRAVDSEYATNRGLRAHSRDEPDPLYKCSFIPNVRFV